MPSCGSRYMGIGSRLLPTPRESVPMNAKQLRCPHCEVLLRPTPGATVVLCPQCGRHYQMIIHGRKSDTAPASNPPASGHSHSPRKGHSFVARILVVLAGVLGVVGVVALVLALMNTESEHPPAPTPQAASPLRDATKKPRLPKPLTSEVKESKPGGSVPKPFLVSKPKKTVTPEVPPGQPERAIYQTAAPATPGTSQIDRLVNNKLKEKGVT